MTALLRRLPLAPTKVAFFLRHYGAANHRFHSSEVAEDAPNRPKVRADFPTFSLDTFALRQFDDPAYPGTIINYDKNAFEAKINEFFEAGECSLVDGYAPFCKHLFVPNFINARIPTVTITNKSAHLLQSGYISRVPEELPVLTRWFPGHSVTPETAKYLDIVLYSREQVRLENVAMGKLIDSVDSPWRIISIKAQLVDYELPMEPMTLLRNALGTDAGGSGVPLDKEKYLESVEYWAQHAHVKYH
ncbi:hypothetical protein H310_11869 [Aphanomyces invadans]|uniref:Uncharacterized protein n=1 Tax=Aphanomyces invadans TaxID=157072 RepID=A0A024TKP0_9STRA|nr:hypothetical protein H310_11869 [Aphanomyces invadans]ETV94608.1 hypothetical protein H310_11869 [Aphanomyces invadans]RHY25409.1 hypothetical protein DYB32_008332 [Aphanomyces invadans]|eukprot:XP_008876923.1 hypothetical protein H310_11869 [Aphanomyces invadans]